MCRRAKWLLLLTPVFLLGLAHADRDPDSIGNWRRASRAPAGLAPDPAVTLEPVVQVYAARTVGWRGNPHLTPAAYAAVFENTGGIPRKTNHLMDRLLLMGFLEEMQDFTDADVDTVIRDIAQEFQPPPPEAAADGADGAAMHAAGAGAIAFGNQYPAVLDERMMRVEKSLTSVLSILKKIVRSPSSYTIQQDSNE